MSWQPAVIIVGVDGSAQSLRAAQLGADMARGSGTLHLVAVVRPPEGWWGIVGSPPTATALAEALERAQREVLDVVIASTDLDAVVYEAVEEVGDPGHVLVNYAGSTNADLLIVGRRGANLLERMVMGSVTGHVVNDSPCPVVVVP